jgi:hypothetical protein
VPHEEQALCMSSHTFLRDHEDDLRQALDWVRTLRKTVGAGAGGRGPHCEPRLVFRGGEAPASIHRTGKGNPEKMELFDRVFFEAAAADGQGEPPRACGPNASPLLRAAPDRRWSFLDYFDLTWGWHFSLEASDGGHYGRGPEVVAAHKCTMETCNFVDVLSVHLFLNDICP